MIGAGERVVTRCRVVLARRRGTEGLSARPVPSRQGNGVFPTKIIPAQEPHLCLNMRIHDRSLLRFSELLLLKRFGGLLC